VALWKRKKGFTLIELLVVIAIIALLVSILLPTLGMAKELARFTVCKSNLHQYGIGMETYLTSNNDRFPHPELIYLDWTKCTYTQISQWGSSGWCRWHFPNWEFNGHLWPNLADKDVHMCPSFYPLALRDGCDNCLRRDGDVDFKPRYTYSQNTYLGHYAFTSPVGNRKMNEGILNQVGVKDPSNTLLFTEENPLPIPRVNTNGLNDNIFCPTKGGGRWGDAIGGFHIPPDGGTNAGFGNVVFADGHVEAAKPRDSWELAGTHLYH